MIGLSGAGSGGESITAQYICTVADTVSGMVAPSNVATYKWTDASP